MTLAGLTVATTATAQTSVPYFKTQFSAPYLPITGGTVVPFTNNDDSTVQIPIGFTFAFYGVDYTNVYVCTNGAMSFRTSFISTGAFGSPAIPSLNSPDALIAPYWDDLYISPGAVTYQVQGVSPNRELVVQWAAVGHYDFGGASISNITMQVRLSEASGAVRLHYGAFSQVASENTLWSGTIGIQNETATVGEVGLPCATNSACGVTELLALNNQAIEWAAPAGVELVPGGVPPTGGNPGDMVDVVVSVRNIGTLSATTAFSADVYFSTDDTIDGTDTLLGSVNFAAPVLSRTAVTATLTAQVPNVAAGFYTIGVVLDPTNAVAEDIEANNTALLTNTFLVGSDLSAEIDTPPDSGAGETVNLTVRILNLGASQGAVPLRIFYSRDQVIDPLDTIVATATVSVPAAPSTSFSFPTVLPSILPAGYYAIVEIDPNNTIIEADETNNIAVSPGLSTLEGPDLTADSIDATGDFAFRGGNLEVFGTIGNEGLATATGYYYGIYLSENQLCSAVSDPLLGEFGPATLGPQGSVNFSHQVTVPANLNPVPHHLCLIVNVRSTVLESNQNNNIDRTVRTLDVRDPQADFQVTEIRLPPRAAAGESVTLQRTLFNGGNAQGSVDYEVYLSLDTTLEPDQDASLGTLSASLAAGAEDVGVDTLRIPPQVSGGAYYVIYRVDPADLVPELSESNNQLVSGRTLPVLSSDLIILTQALPLATVGVPYDVVLAAGGAAGNAVWAVQQGSLPAGISLDAGTGRLSGTPTEEAAAALTISVTDGALSVSAQFVLRVTSQTTTLEIVTHALPPGFVSRRYEYPVTAFGGVPPYSWSLTGGDPLPGNFVFSPQGIVAGTPASTGLVQLNVRVTDALGAFAERPLVLRIVDATDSVRLSNDVLPDGRLDEAYAETLTVASGTGSSPFVFSIASGELPPGLSLNMDKLTGTPQRVGIFVFSVRVSDSRGDFDVNSYVIEVDEGQGLTFVTNALPRAVLGEPYLEAGSAVQIKAISAASTGTVSFALVGGGLPPGLSMASDGTISGTPSSSGTFSVLVLARDDLGQMDTRAYGVVVDEPVIVTPPVPVDNGGCRCVSDAAAGRGLWSFAGLIGLGLGLLGRRRRRGLLTLLLGAVVLMPSIASAQTPVPYFVDTRTEPYVELAGGTPLSFSSTDDGQAAVTLPFAFRFYGVDHTTLNVGTNGYIAFGVSATSLSNGAMPSTSAPNNLIAAWWDDLITTAASTHLQGTAPARVFIIQYESVTAFSGGSGNPKFQFWLYEGPGGRFEVRYGAGTGIVASAWSASAGWENATGTEGGNLLGCVSPSCSGAALIAAANTVVRVQADAGPDISANGIAVPSLVYAGVPFSTDVSVGSLHQNPLGPFVYTVHVMAPTDVVPNNPVFTSAPITLTPYQQATLPATPTLPLGLPVGRYRLAVVVDSADQLVEPDESNNVFISTDTLRLAAQQPDFVVAGVEASVPNVAPSGSFQASMFLRNRGNLSGTSDWRLVLSRNQVVSREDFLLASGTEVLPLLTTATVTVDVTLPPEVSAGQYYLGVVMDPDNTVAEIDEVNNSGVSATPISVASNAVNVLTQALPGAYVGIAYTHFLRATGGDGAYNWSVTSGSLPAGLSLVPNSGEIRGAPTTVEQASLTFQVQSAGQSATVSLSIDVARPEGGVTIVNRALLPGLVGAAYPPSAAGTSQEMQQHIEVLGANGAVTIEAEGSLPAGIELDSDGYLHGTPVQAGVFDVRVLAKDSVGETRRTLPLTIANPGRLTLVASTLPDGRVGNNYNYELRVIGRSSTATVSFSAQGPLPPGVVVSLEGLIVGIPQQVGTWVFSVTASEGVGGGAAQDSATFRLAVTQDDGFEIVETGLPFATVGLAYETDVGTRMGTPPLTWRVMGPALPRGLSFEVVTDNATQQKLRFRGVAEEAETVSVLVTVKDGAGRSAQQPFTIEVREPEVVVPPVPVDEGCVCVNTRGNSGPMGWSMLMLLGLWGLRRRR